MARIAPSQEASPSPSPRLLRTEEELARLPVSERIRYRLVSADRRYHANDNIAGFIHEGELDELKAEVQAKLQEVLQALVIDTESDHNTNETATRVARMYVDEVFRGRYRPERRAAERADDRRPDHRAQCVQPPHVPDLRQGVDRHPAERAQQPDRPVQVRAHH
jgi:hypothetical protein